MVDNCKKCTNTHFAAERLALRSLGIIINWVRSLACIFRNGGKLCVWLSEAICENDRSQVNAQKSRVGNWRESEFLIVLVDSRGNERSIAAPVATQLASASVHNDRHSRTEPNLSAAMWKGSFEYSRKRFKKSSRNTQTSTVSYQHPETTTMIGSPSAAVGVLSTVDVSEYE